MGVPLISIKEIKLYGFNAILKRITDILFSLVIITLLLPLFLFLASIIKMDSRGKIFFTQSRIGRDGKRFKMYKFRSMISNAEEMQANITKQNEADGPIFKIKKDPRITRIGKVLRKLSMDELPQIFNVLRGEMSLVGPRPPLPKEVEKYNTWHLKRLHVNPGMTGLWQVSGRSDLPFEEMVKLDIYYIQTWSVWQDIKILLKTIPVVLFTKGAY